MYAVVAQRSSGLKSAFLDKIDLRRAIYDLVRNSRFHDLQACGQLPQVGRDPIGTLAGDYSAHDFGQRAAGDRDQASGGLPQSPAFIATIVVQTVGVVSIAHCIRPSRSRKNIPSIAELDRKSTRLNSSH